MNSLFNKLRAFAMQNGLELNTIFHEDILSQVMYFKKPGSENTWSFTIEPALLAAMSDHLVKQYVYERIISGVTENLLRKEKE